MARSMGGGRSGGGRSGGSRSGGGRSSSSRSMGSSRGGTSRSFGSGHSGGSSSRGSGRSYSGQSSSGNPFMGGGFGGSGSHGGPGSFGGPGPHGGPGGPGHHNPPPPPRRHHHHYYGGRRYYNNGYHVHHHTSGGGCSSLFTILIMFIILASIITSWSRVRSNNKMYYNYTAPSYSDTYSNVEREKFTGTVNLNGYYSDPDGILYDDEISPLEKGLSHFYKTTGVCAYVYFVEELDPDVDGTDEAARLYEELFSDEGHILLLYDYNNAYMYDAMGYEIGVTLDSEAIDILYDYVEAQWSKDSENLGAIFGDGCAMAADRIMYKERTFAERYKSIIIVVIVAVVLIVVISILFKWWKAKTVQKNKEQEDLERTLKTPLETFGDSPVDDLAKKYDNDPNNNSQ